MVNKESSLYIGLRINKLCSTDDFHCRRGSWDWDDESNFTYPDWHDWATKKEPHYEDKCVVLTSNGWIGADCLDLHPFICEMAYVPSKCIPMFVFKTNPKSYKCIL